MDGGCNMSLNTHKSEFKSIRPLTGSRSVQGASVDLHQGLWHCGACLRRAKQTARAKPADDPLQRFFADLYGPVTGSSPHGMKYALHVTNHYTTKRLS